MAAGGEAPAGAPRESSGSAGAQVGEQRRELAPCLPPPSPVTARLPGSCRCCGEAAPRLAPFPRLPVRPHSSSASRDSPAAAGGRLPPSFHPAGDGRCLRPAALPAQVRPRGQEGPGARLRCPAGSGGARGPRPPLGRGQSRRARPALSAAGGAPGWGPRPPVGFRPWGSARGIPPVNCASSLPLLPIPSSVALEGLRAFSKKDAP